MAFYVYITIYYILEVIYSSMIFLIVSKFSRYPKTGLTVLIIYQILYYAFDWVTTDYGPSSLIFDPQIMTIFNISNFVFTIGFLSFFMKGNPILNYLLVYSTYPLVILPLFTLTNLQKVLFPQCPTLAHMQNWQDWPAVVSHGIADFLTLCIFYLLIKKCKPMLERIPQTIISVITFTIVFMDMFMTFYMLLHENLNKETIAISSILILIFIMVFICLSMIAIHYHQEITNQKLITMETQIYYGYYTTICQLTKQLRHMKHDIANHMSVIDISRQTDPAAQQQYKEQLLSHCNDIKTAISKLISPENLMVSKLNKKENYQFLYYLTILTNDLGLDLQAQNIIKTTNAQGYENISIIFPITAKELNKKSTRENIYFKLVQTNIAKYNGHINWEKGGKRWTLTLNI